ncbi:hypothetical protein CEV32_3371 [Brucella rhizosphaerae]|uniref:Uncharacterized protein n=1 Tax=Brucella rhizosphaerae TaxID=571254 RepID=A0A256FU70_9HYPH|nr:hypothetical protein CEV32_3371 [Brucella rhizosphaerae]
MPLNWCISSKSAEQFCVESCVEINRMAGFSLKQAFLAEPISTTPVG